MTGKIRIREYFGKYHSNSIFFRNLALILLMVAVPLVILSLFTYHYSRILLDEEIHKANTRSLLKFQSSMDLIQREAERSVIQMINSEDVGRFINADLTTYPDYRQIETMESIIHDMKLLIHSYIYSIYVYSNKSSYLLTPAGGGDIGKWRNLSVHNRIHSEVSEWYFDYQYDNVPNLGSNPEKMLTYYRKVSRREGDDREGIVALLLDMGKLKTFLFGDEPEAGEIMFVVNGEGKVLFSTDISWLDRKTEEIFPGQERIDLDEAQPRQLKYGGKPYVFSYLPSDENDWIYCALLSREDYFAKQTRLRNIMIISLMFSLAVSVATAFLVSLYVFKPIHEVISMLEDPGYLDSYTGGDDELKFIAGNIMQSFGEYQTNREEVQKRANLLNTARVRALQAQINPHFLNNTLQLVNWTIMKETRNEDSEAIEILENLADLVRVNMETKNNITTLAEEAGYAARYMAIQEKRYGSKIKYEQSIPEDLLDKPVLKMILQPLVENAIYHGLKKSDRSGLITLEASSGKNALRIDVEDNGIGMDISDMAELNREIAAAESLTDSHIGLTNVSLRLRLVFGQEASLALFPGKDRGVRATVKIPLPQKS